MPLPDLNRDPYPHLPRILVVEATDHNAARQAYPTDPRTFLLGQDPVLNTVLPPASANAFYLFQPDPLSIPTSISNKLFSFVGFHLPDLVSAEHALAQVNSYIHPAVPPQSPPKLTHAYIQGLFGSPSEELRERNVGVQDYVQPARYGGIDAMHAWTLGATGRLQTLYLLESGWWPDHVEFNPASIFEYQSSPQPGELLPWVQHGTATLGVILASMNTQGHRRGMVGIAHEANARIARAVPGEILPPAQIGSMVADAALGGRDSVVLLEM
jgi:hypothetical protein